MKPWQYALAAVFLVPVAVIVLIVAAVLSMAAWPLAPLFAYCASTHRRKNYGTVRVPCNDPANCGCDGYAKWTPARGRNPAGVSHN